MMQFEDKLTPQTLLEAIRTHYKPDDQQEIERLENEFNNLEYNSKDSVGNLFHLLHFLPTFSRT